MTVSTEKLESSHIILHITPDSLQDNDINGYELFTIAGLYNKKFEEYVNSDLFDDLVAKNFIEVSKYQVKLSNKGLELIRKLTTLNGRFKTRNKNILFQTNNTNSSKITDEFVKKYRSLFKGTKPGAMAGEKGVKHKLERFMLEHPKVTEDIILEAARRYINSLDSFKYIQQADYFIYKRELYNNEESSRLAAYVDEVLMNPGQDNDDWTSNII